MNSSQRIGQIISSTDNLIVQRQGEQLSLRQGDAILAGDVIQNRENTPIEIELPAQAPGQADSLLSLAPDSAALISLRAEGSQPLVEVSPLTGGVELYAVSQGDNGAVLLAEAGGEFSGLVGTGLLSAGSFTGAGGLATAIGGGVGVAALATSSGDDINTSGNTFTDVRVDNPDNTGGQPPTDGETDPETPPSEPEEPANPENPDEPGQPEDPGTMPPGDSDGDITGTPLDILLDPLADLLDPLADLLDGTPLSAVTDPVFNLLDTLPSLPIGSAPNPAESLPVDSLTGGLPV